MNMVKFGVVTKVCRGYAFARVMDNSGTLTSKEVYLNINRFVVVDERESLPVLMNIPDPETLPQEGDYIAFLYFNHPIYCDGATPVFRWGILSNHDSASTSGVYTGPLMEMDSLESDDPEIERLARSTCGQNGVKHNRPDERPAYSTPHRGVSNHTNPSQRQNRRRQYSENHQNGDNGQRKDAAAVYIVT